MSVSGEALARLAGKAWDAADRAALEEMKRVRHPDPRSLARAGHGVQERAKAIEREVGARRTAKGVDGAKVLAEFREELKRVAAGN